MFNEGHLDFLRFFLGRHTGYEFMTFGFGLYYNGQVQPINEFLTHASY